MSISPDAPRKLVSDTGAPTPEIVVIDATGTLRSRAVGRLEVELPPGLYKLRYRVGNRVVDQLVELPAGAGDFVVKSPELAVPTPVPLGTLNEPPPAKGMIARDWSLKTHVNTGTGSKILLFLDAPRDLPGMTLELGTFDGTTLADLSAFQQGDDCSGCSVQLNPGVYRLRAAEGPDTTVERTIVASPEWQTQVFLSPTQHESRWRVDVSEGAVLMRRLGQGFDPNAQDFRWTEAARQTLASGRQVAPNERLMRQLLARKFDEPMLGICAGHLLAYGPETQLLEEVVKNLRSLLGDHPDVMTLLFPLTDPGAPALRYAEPPMLRSSWTLIVKNSGVRPDPRPPRSYSARIAGSLWGTGAWLAWQTPPPAMDPTPASESVTLDLPRLAEIAMSASFSAPNMPELTPAERALLSVLRGASTYIQFAKALSTTLDGNKRLPWIYPLLRLLRSSDIEKDTEQKIAEALAPKHVALLTGIPYSTLLEAATSLGKKLGVEPAQSHLFSLPRLFLKK